MTCLHCYYCFYYYFHLTAIFPVDPSSAGSPLILLLHMFWKRTFGITATGFRRMDVLSATQPAVSKTQSIDPNQSPGIVLSSEWKGHHCFL